MNKESGIRNYGKEVLKKFIHNSLIIIRKRSGQSLIEIIVALTIGALLIGAASLALVFVLRSSTTNQGLHSANVFSQDYIDKTRTLADSNWQSVYGLQKGTSTSYMIVASGTNFLVMTGKEGVIENDIEDNLVGRWKFDEDPSVLGTQTLDFSSNQNHGAFVNNPTRSTSTCYAGDCISFNGVDARVSVPAPIINAATSSITVAAWVRVSSHVNSYNYVSNNWATSPGAWLLYSNLSGEALFGVVDGTLSQKNAHGCASSFTTSTWHWVVGTYDGASVRVYLDGAGCSITSALPNQLLYTASPITIGSWGTPGATTHFMDDVRIYNRALPANDIAKIFKSTSFSRKFFVENTCRTNDSAAIISGTSPCVGSIEDPSTQKITVVAEWVSSGNTYQNRLVEYITRWKNKIFQQTDWSGGSGVNGPLNNPGRTFSSSTNIEGGAEPGTIKIKGI